MNHITMSVFRRLRVRKYDFCKDNFEAFRVSKTPPLRGSAGRRRDLWGCGLCVSVYLYNEKRG